MSRVFSLIVVGMIAMASIDARAEKATGSGNGGDGVLVGAKIYLLDFYEAGVHKAPSFDKSVATRQFIERRVNDALGHLADAPIAEISQKLSDLFEYDAAFAISILKSIEFHSWSLVPEELVNIADEETVLNFDPKKLVQLAVRAGSTIRLRDDTWTKLDVPNRVGLIFHEAVYALVKPVSLLNNEWIQQSITVRNLVGYIFGPQLKKRGVAGLERAVSDWLPFCSGSLYIESKNRLECTPRVIVQPADRHVMGKAVLTLPHEYVTDTNQLQKSAEKYCARADVLKDNAYHKEYDDLIVVLETTAIDFSNDILQTPVGPRHYLRTRVFERREFDLEALKRTRSYIYTSGFKHSDPTHVRFCVSYINAGFEHVVESSAARFVDSLKQP